ncbi:MAG TPA: hypothetical protein PLF26_14075 [Blastocatellia bacterium]|nr:hypothetical protein [Blastocatellia bacterium]
MIQPGSFVIIHLQSPKEKFWGLLADLNAAGATILGIDLNSFEDWTRMVVANGRNIGLTAMFHPMWRVERISLDQTIDDLLSLQAQFEMRVGVPVRQYLEGQLPDPGEPDADRM